MTLRLVLCGLFVASCVATAEAQRLPPPSTADGWLSPHNQKRLAMDQQVLPEFAETKHPDGSVDPPRAPWPFLLVISGQATDARDKLETRVFNDTRFIFATHAVKVVRIKPEQAIELSYLAKVKGIQDPTLVFVDRDFQVTDVLNREKSFDERGVLGPMLKLADDAYAEKVAGYIAAMVKVMQKEEALWKDETKASKLQEKAANAKGDKQEKYDAEADALEEKVAIERDELAGEYDLIVASLRLKEAEAAPEPTSIGKGKGKQTFTPDELEAIATYREFARHENPIVRAAAVEDLGAQDSAAMALFVLGAAKDRDPRVTAAAGHALAQMSSAEALDVMRDALSSGGQKAEAALLAFANLESKVPGAAAALSRHLTAGDENLRRAALLAIVRQGDPSASAAVAPLLEDRVPALRVMAAEALGGLKGPAGANPLLRALEAKDWSLQKASADALGELRVAETIEPLIARFEVAEGILREALYDALVSVTGQDYGPEPAGWRRWWDRYGDRFRLPTDEEVAEARRKAEESMAGYRKPGVSKYHEITTLSESMVFVIDISASMREKIAVPLTVSEEDAAKYPSRVKMDIAKNELIALLGSLERHVKFNILTFAGEVESWKPDLVSASSRTAAIKYVASLEAMQPPTTTRRRGAAGGDEQKTNTYAAILTAFGLADKGATDWKSRTKADTIFFVTDGLPTVGEIVDVPQLVDAVTEMNRSRGVTIHLVLFDKQTARRLKGLAERNGGQCVVRGF